MHIRFLRGLFKPPPIYLCSRQSSVFFNLSYKVTLLNAEP